MYANARQPQPVFDIDSVFTLTSAEVVNELVDAVGLRVTALIGDVTHAKYVRAWQGGTEPKRRDDLIAGLQAVRAIVAGAGPAAAQRWLLGCNTALDLQSPITFLRKNDPEARRQVLQAAIAFASR